MYRRALKKIIDDRSSEVGLTRVSKKKANQLALVWGGVGYFLGLGANYLNIHVTDADWFDHIGTLGTSIVAMSKGSKFPEGMAVAWLYGVLTMPLLLVMLFRLDLEFKRKRLRAWMVFFWLGVCFACTMIVLSGSEFGGRDSKDLLGRLYYQNFLISCIVAFGAPMSVSYSIFALWHHFSDVVTNLKKEF